jgi:hypothetical protein
MIYYKISAKEENSAKQIIRTLKNSHTWVRSNGNPLELYSATGNDHTKHVLGIATEFNANVSEIDKAQIPQDVANHGGIPKREYISFDNQVFTDKMQFSAYERNNNPKHIEGRKNKITKLRKPRANKAEIVARLEPGQDFNMTGVINSLKILEDKLLQAYNEVSDLGKKLSKINEFTQLLKDRDDYLNSARMILNSDHNMR